MFWERTAYCNGFSGKTWASVINVLSDQCKEIEENNRMGKTRDLLKKIRDTKETLHAEMGTIKDRNGMDLTEAGSSAGSSKKQESSRKTSISALLTMPGPLNVWITINCGKL